jgi:hypothetical protein
VSGFFATIPVDDGALATWGIMPTNNMNPYSGGTFVFNNNGDLFSDLSAFAWGAQGSDLAFEMVLGQTEPSVVPEPATVLLMGTGMGILLLGAARRRRRT